MAVFNLPPGCSVRDIENAMGHEEPCLCCGNMPDDCICPECICGDAGNPKCYEVTEVPAFGDAPGTEQIRSCCVGKFRLPALKYNRRQRLGQLQRQLEYLGDWIAEQNAFIDEGFHATKESDYYVSDEVLEKTVPLTIERIKRVFKP